MKGFRQHVGDVVFWVHFDQIYHLLRDLLSNEVIYDLQVLESVRLFRIWGNRISRIVVDVNRDCPDRRYSSNAKIIDEVAKVHGFFYRIT